jgi:S1-C subfamily serine protease
VWSTSRLQRSVTTSSFGPSRNAPGTEWVPVPLGTTEGLQVGQKVLAIGNPFGLEGTLTTGIISSLGRSIEAANGQVIEGIIQTDAAINPGNSGGPLLNARGEIIGINTAIVSPANAGSVGIGFAVPVETVRRVSQDLITYGRVRRVYMGFQGYDLAQMGRLADALDLGTDHGVLVTDISPGSPADRGGLRGSRRTVNVGNYRLRVGGDVIVSIEGRQVDSTVEIRTILDPYRPGDGIDVTVVRDGNRVELEMTLEEQPSGP